MSEEQAQAQATNDVPELKLVIITRGNKASVGIQAPGCDPFLETIEAPRLEGVLLLIPGLVRRAQEQWRERPKYPKYQRPTPPPAPTPPRTAAPRASTEPAKEEQHSMV